MDRNILHIAELLKEGVGDEARVPQLPEVSKRVGERRRQGWQGTVQSHGEPDKAAGLQHWRGHVSGRHA